MAELPSVRGLEPVAIPHRVVDPLLLGEDVRVGEQFDADRTPDILTVDHGPPPPDCAAEVGPTDLPRRVAPGKWA